MPPKTKEKLRAGGDVEAKRSRKRRTALAKPGGVFLHIRTCVRRPTVQHKSGIQT